MKNIFNNTKIQRKIILATIGLLLILCYCCFFYINRISIIEPVAIEINETTVFSEFRIIGIGPLNRSFTLNKIDSIKQYNTKGFFLKKIVIEYNLNTDNDTTISIYVNGKKEVIPLNIANKGLDQAIIPINIQHGFWEKLLLLFMFYLGKLTLIIKFNIAIPTIKLLSHISFNILLLIISISLIIIQAFYSKKKQQLVNYTNIALVFLSILIISVIIYTSFYIYFTGEEYLIAGDAQSYKSWLPIYYYISQDGRYLTNLLYVYANPLYYNMHSLMFLPTVILLLLLIIGVYLFVKELDREKKPIRIMIVSLLFIFMFINYAPDPTCMFFWYGSAIGYTLLNCMLIFLAMLTIKLFRSKTNKRLCSIIIALSIISIIGINELGIIISGFYLLALFYKYRKINMHTVLIVLSYCLLVIFVLLSPGSYFKKEIHDMVNEPLNLMTSPFINIVNIFVKSMVTTLTSYSNLITNFQFLIFLLLLKPIYDYLEPFVFSLNAKKIVFVSLIIFVFNFSLEIPFHYAYTDIASGINRISNIQHFFILINILIVATFIHKKYAFSTIITSQVNRKTIIIASIILAFSAPSLLNTFADDVYNKRLVGFKKEMNKRIELYQTTQNFDCPVKLTPISNKPKMVYSIDENNQPIFKYDIMRFFNNYNLVFPENKYQSFFIEKGLYFDVFQHYQYMGDKPVNIKLIFNSPSNNIIFLRFATLLKNYSSLTKLDLFFDFNNVFEQVAVIDSSMLKCLPDSIAVKKPSELSIIERLSVYSTFASLLPASIIEVNYSKIENNNYKVIFKVLNYSSKTTDNLCFEYNAVKNGQISKIQLADYYKDLFRHKSMFYTQMQFFKPQIIYFKPCFNKKSFTIDYELSIISNSKYLAGENLNFNFLLVMNSDTISYCDHIVLQKDFLPKEEIIFKSSVKTNRKFQSKFIFSKPLFLITSIEKNID